MKIVLNEQNGQNSEKGLSYGQVVMRTVLIFAGIAALFGCFMSYKYGYPLYGPTTAPATFMASAKGALTFAPYGIVTGLILGIIFGFSIAKK